MNVEYIFNVIKELKVLNEELRDKHIIFDTSDIVYQTINPSREINLARDNIQRVINLLNKLINDQVNKKE